jgi:phosphatidylserine/phosphatidylglycerophosphate/cardiolipin synthase-like enzyme
MKSLRLLLVLAGWTLAAPAIAFDASDGIQATGTIEYAFTPGADAAGLIIRRIDAARLQILVQAFTFTHRDIADALIRAHRRGVDVQILADQEQTDVIESAAMRSLIEAGVPVFTDAEHSAAHNKVVVIDHAGECPALITGSFNFTFAAQNRNAENVLVLLGNRELAHAFHRNWQAHREHSLALIRSRVR